MNPKGPEGCADTLRMVGLLALIETGTLDEADIDALELEAGSLPFSATPSRPSERYEGEASLDRIDLIHAWATWSEGKGSLAQYAARDPKKGAEDQLPFSCEIEAPKPKKKKVRGPFRQWLDRNIKRFAGKFRPVADLQARIPTAEVDVALTNAAGNTEVHALEIDDVRGMGFVAHLDRALGIFNAVAMVPFMLLPIPGLRALFTASTGLIPLALTPFAALKGPKAAKDMLWLAKKCAMAGLTSSIPGSGAVILPLSARLGYRAADRILDSTPGKVVSPRCAPRA